MLRNYVFVIQNYLQKRKVYTIWWRLTYGVQLIGCLPVKYGRDSEDIGTNEF